PRVGDDAEDGGALLAKIKAVRAVPLDDAVGGGGKLVEKALDLGFEIAGAEIGRGAAGRELAGKSLNFGVELIRRRIGRDGGHRRGKAKRHRRCFRSEPQPHFPAPLRLSPLPLGLTIAELCEKPGTEQRDAFAVSRLWQTTDHSL